MHLELATVAEEYSPACGANGEYYDDIPPITRDCGLRCSCNGLSHAYLTRPSFKSHCKSKRHVEWLVRLNLDRHNHYRELREAKKVIQDQQIIIARLLRDLAKRPTPPTPPPVVVGDLISFD